MIQRDDEFEFGDVKTNTISATVHAEPAIHYQVSPWTAAHGWYSQASSLWVHPTESKKSWFALAAAQGLGAYLATVSEFRVDEEIKKCADRCMAFAEEMARR